MKKLSFRERIDQVFEAYQSDLPRCEKELKLMLKEAENRADLYSIGKINLRLAMCIFRQGKRDNLFSCAYKAVSIFEKTNEHALLARSINMLGIGYASQGSFHCAIAMYRRALCVIHGKKKPGVSKDLLMNNIGDAFYNMGAYDQSLRIALDCLANCKRNEPENHRVMTLYGMNVFDSYCGLGEYQKAKEHLDEVAPNAKRLNKNVVMNGYYTRRAVVLYAMGDPEQAAQYADRVIDMVQSNYDTYEIHRYYEQIAYYQVDHGDLERAQHFSEILQHYAEESSNTLDQIISNRVLAKICMAKGETETALELYRELNELFKLRLSELDKMQYESQKNVETVNHEIIRLMERIRANEELAERDSLTGLLNRSAMVRISTDFIKRAKEKKKKIGGIFLDIDYFKEFNDTYGHTVGDEAIRYVAQTCMQEENASVRFFRYGGDEFFGIVLSQKDEDLEALALRLSEKIRASGFEHLKNPNGKCLTVSVGVVNLSMRERESAYSVLDIVKYADHALYHAKDAGKNVVFESRQGAGRDYEFRQIASD